MILKNPTWQSLSPRLPHYIPLEEEQALKLQNIIQVSGKLFHAHFDGKPSPFYKLEDGHSKKKIFIKQVIKDHHDHYHQSEQIARWLQDHAIHANSIISITKSSDGEHYYYLYPLLEGVRIPITSEALARLGQSLATLHQALRHYPWQAQLALNTQKRISTLEAIRQQIKHDQLTIGPIADYVKNMAQSPNYHFTAGHSVQPLHGDLNPGNLIFQNNTIHYLDFEDTLHSVLPTIYELGYILERFIFTQTTDQNTMIELGKRFMQAYLANHGNYTFHENDIHVLSTLALRSFCVLTLCEIKGNSIHDSEWYKFQRLAELAKKTQRVLNIILPKNSYRFL